MKNKILLIILLLNNVIYANNLSMQECIDKSIQNYPDIKSFELKVTQSKQSYDSAFSEYLPQVNLQAEYNPIQTFVLPVNGTFSTNDNDSWSAGVYLKQKIWDFQKTSSKVDASRFDEDISKLSLKDAQALLVNKVKSLYLKMILQQEAIKVRKKDLEAKVAYYDQSLALVEQGLKTKADSSRFLASVYDAKDNLAIAYAIYEKAKVSLGLYMGENIDNDVELENSIIKKDYNFKNNLEENILTNNYQLQIDSKNIDKNRLLHKSAKASHYGSVDGYASYNHVDSLSEYDSKLVGISLTVPLYTGGRTSADEQKAQISTQISKQAQASKKLALKDELTGLVIDIKSYDETILAKKAQIDAANESKNVLEARYKEGLSTYIEVLDSISVVLNAELGLLQTYYSKSISINQIQYLEGKI